MLSFQFTPFPEFTTARLVLRRIQQFDIAQLYAMRSNPAIMQYIPRPLAQSEADVVALIERIDNGINNNETINWAIALKSSNLLIGTIGYVRATPEHHRAEIGYMLHSDYHQQGIMYEAIQPILDYGKNGMHLHSIQAIVDPDNIASARLLEKTNFVRSAYFKEYDFWQGIFLDSVHYHLLC